ncbi:MAG: VWA domain-containing protein [Bacteroidota bacterium]
MITRLLSVMALLLIAAACNHKTGADASKSSANSQQTLPEIYHIPPVETEAPVIAEAPLPPPPPPAIEEVPEEEMEVEDLPMPSPSNRENYAPIYENDYNEALSQPFSTFSIDVDRAAYSNTRRFLNQGQLPPVDAVRLEEFINYFDYDYPQPKGEVPFSVNTEVAPCPWNAQHQLVHIGLQGRHMPKENLPPNNLVFLIDVSGSMSDYDKLPLLKGAFQMLVEQLRPSDRVAIVVYAGASGLVLPSTPGLDKARILRTLNQLDAGGSTAGGQGIQLAYQTARRYFIEGGNNRIILATDGDFNVGVHSTEALVRLIEKERQDGIYLSVLGFGTGNYKDAQMEQLADHGNGNYAYIDQLSEAKKVLVNEFSSTLFTIAKDVKIQVEFNPKEVKAYRLLGYENRLLEEEDFNDDLKDAGEIGAGHSVTALYEVVPAESSEVLTTSNGVDVLKYQERRLRDSPELMTVKLRYKPPHLDKSSKIEVPVLAKRGGGEDAVGTTANFRFSAAVAGFGLLLRNSKYKGAANYRLIRQLAKGAVGNDPHDYRKEFLQLVKLAEQYDQRLSAN